MTFRNRSRKLLPPRGVKITVRQSCGVAPQLSRCIYLVLMAHTAVGQSVEKRDPTDALLLERPEFHLPPGSLRPGGIVVLYGSHLGNESANCEQPTRTGPYPQRACGVRVKVGNDLAYLLYLDTHQIRV